MDACYHPEQLSTISSTQSLRTGRRISAPPHSPRCNKASTLLLRLPPVQTGRSSPCCEIRPYSAFYVFLPDVYIKNFFDRKKFATENGGGTASLPFTCFDAPSNRESPSPNPHIKFFVYPVVLYVTCLAKKPSILKHFFSAVLPVPFWVSGDSVS